jgi:hypothetical protein
MSKVEELGKECRCRVRYKVRYRSSTDVSMMSVEQNPGKGVRYGKKV